MDGYLDPVRKSNQCSRPRQSPSSISLLFHLRVIKSCLRSLETRLECQGHLLVILMRQLRGGRAFYSGDDYELVHYCVVVNRLPRWSGLNSTRAGHFRYAYAIAEHFLIVECFV